MAKDALKDARRIAFDMLYTYPDEGPGGSAPQYSRFFGGDFTPPAGFPEKHTSVIIYDARGSMVACSVLY